MKLSNCRVCIILPLHMHCINYMILLRPLICINISSYFKQLLTSWRPNLKKFKKYWEHISLLYCIRDVLDPKIKLQGVDYLPKGIVEKLQVSSNIINIQNVKTNMKIIFNAYNEKYGGTHVVSPPPSTINTIPPWEVMMNLVLVLVLALHLHHLRHAQNWRIIIKQILLLFLLMSNVVVTILTSSIFCQFGKHNKNVSRTFQNDSWYNNFSNVHGS